MMFVWKLALVIAFVGVISSRPFDKEKPQKYGDATDYIVVFKNGFDVFKSSDAVFKHFAQFKPPPKVRWVYSKVIHGVSFSGVSRDALEWLGKQEYVAYVEESLQMSSQECTVSSPSAAVEMDQTVTYINWGLDRITEATFTKTSYTYDPIGHGSGSVIYVMDSGIRISHNEFDTTRFSNLFTISDSGNYDDCSSGHGTQVAGIAAGSTLGAANLAKVKNVKIAGCNNMASIANVLEGFDEIYNDVVTNSYQDKCVISLSYSLTEESNTLHDAIKNITSNANCIVVAAAGNYDTSDNYWPAAWDETISVGAINAKPVSKLACFSNYGTSVDIYAPGSNLWTAHSSANNEVVRVKGTSFSTPMVSGVVAILLERTDINSNNLKSELIDLATKSPAIPNLPSGSYSRILFINST